MANLIKFVPKELWFSSILTDKTLDYRDKVALRQTDKSLYKIVNEHLKFNFKENFAAISNGVLSAPWKNISSAPVEYTTLPNSYGLANGRVLVPENMSYSGNSTTLIYELFYPETNTSDYAHIKVPEPKNYSNIFHTNAKPIHGSQPNLIIFRQEFNNSCQYFIWPEHLPLKEQAVLHSGLLNYPDAKIFNIHSGKENYALLKLNEKYFDLINFKKNSTVTLDIPIELISSKNSYTTSALIPHRNALVLLLKNQHSKDPLLSHDALHVFSTENGELLRSVFLYEKPETIYWSSNRPHLLFAPIKEGAIRLFDSQILQPLVHRQSGSPLSLDPDDAGESVKAMTLIGSTFFVVSAKKMSKYWGKIPVGYNHSHSLRLWDLPCAGNEEQITLKATEKTAYEASYFEKIDYTCAIRIINNSTAAVLLPENKHYSIQIWDAYSCTKINTLATEICSSISFGVSAGALVLGHSDHTDFGNLHIYTTWNLDPDCYSNLI